MFNMAIMAFLLSRRMEIVWLLIVQAVFAYYLVLRLPKGIARLLGLLPLLAGSILVPWRQTTTSERLIYCLLFPWLINTKLLLLAWDMGPAADPSSISSLPRFFCALTCAVHLRRREVVILKSADGVTDGSSVPDSEKDGRDESGSDGRQFENKNRREGSSESGSVDLANGLTKRRFVSESPDDDLKLNSQAELQVKNSIRVATKRSKLSSWVQVMTTSQPGWIGLLQIIFYFTVDMSLLKMVQVWKLVMPKSVLVLVLGFYVYFGGLFFEEGVALIPNCLFGVQLRPQWNMPYRADSLADFWGRRWNLLVSNLLRVSVYEPVLGLLNGRTKPKEWERALATEAAFLVSGLMHELIVFYGTQTWPSWEMTAFFSLHGVLTVLEGIVLKARGRVRLPRLLGWAYTMGIVYLTAYWLFIPPLTRSGIVDTAAEDIFGFLRWSMRGIMGAFIWLH